jgi:uncharacterized protein DUF2167
VAKRRSIAAVLWLILAVAGPIAPGTAAAQSPAPDSPAAGLPLDDRDPKLTAVERHHGGTHVLPISKSTLKVGAEFDVLVGDAAQSYFALKNSQMPVAGLEAVLMHRSSHSTVYLVAESIGYIALDDWASVDPADLLSDMRSHHAVTNLDAAPNGDRPVEVLGWRQRPELDRQGASVFWSVNTTIGGKPFLQATMLQLSRRGVEKLIWIGEPTADPRAILGAVRTALNFPPDMRYQDRRPADPVMSTVDKLVEASIGTGRLSISGGGAASLEAVQTAALSMVGISGAMFLVAFRLRAHKKKVTSQREMMAEDI